MLVEDQFDGQHNTRQPCETVVFTYTVLFPKYTLNVIVLREKFKRRYIKSKFVHGDMYGPPSDRLFATICYPSYSCQQKNSRGE